MPTYIYKCNECDHVFEARQRMSENPITDCPNCATEGSVRRVINSVGIVFKGSGFYVTDTRNGKSSSVGSSNGKGTSSTSDDTTKSTTAAETSKTSSSEKASSD